ncbi:MAG: GGDEF domain-containing protein [Syntrophales bacterium]
MTSLALDIRSLSVVLTAVSAVLTVTMILIWGTHRTYPGFGFWTAGNASSAAGFLLFALRGIVPDIFTIVLANVLVLSTAALYLEGTRRFRGVAARRALSIVLVVFLAASLSYYTYWDSDIGVRIIILSLLVALFYGLGARELLGDAPPNLRFSYRFTGSLFALYSLFMFSRAFFAAFAHGPNDLYIPNLMQTLAFLLPLLLGIAWTFGFVMLNIERLEADLKRAQVELQRLATTDFLTGISNNRSFFAAAEREIQRARRYGHPLGVLMFDIDHFKRVNDTYGHAAGDQVLVAIAAACRNFLRDIDVFGRLGGEEFAVLLPETDLAGGRATAERLRSAIAEIGIEAGVTTLHVTISVGVSVLSPEDDRIEQVLKRADDAMYEAKRDGRNRTMTAAS